MTVSERILLRGAVLISAPSGEYDRRVVLLTADRGRITAFARGARRQNSPLLAATRPYVFGSFELFEGRSAYTLVGAVPDRFFEGIAADVEAACYAAYLAELAVYASRENQPAADILNLLYVSLRALEKPSLPNELVRRVYELRMLRAMGEYYDTLPQKAVQNAPETVREAAAYAYDHALFAPLEKLYTFVVIPEVMAVLGRAADLQMKEFVDRRFHSLEILESMRSF